jgi:oligoendopeptidase F
MVNQVIKEIHIETNQLIDEYYKQIDSEKMTEGRLLTFLKQKEAISAKVDSIFTYAELRVSADQNDIDSLALLNTVRNIVVDIQKKTAFSELELGNLLERRNELIKSPLLSNYKHYMEMTLLKHKYKLSETEERLVLEKDIDGVSAWMQLQSELLGTKIFRAIIDGKEKEFSWSEAQGLMSDPKRENRKATIEGVMNELISLKEIFATALRSICSDHVRMAKKRKHENTMTQSLIKNDITQEMIDNLILALEENLDIYQEILRLKAKLLESEILKGEDLWAPIPQKEETVNVSWESAKELILDTFEEFDIEFGIIVRKMFEENHIDASPRKGKRGGAFCASDYISKECFILQSYNETFDDVGILAHELGHAIQGELVMNSQTTLNYEYSYCVGECASEFGRFLLIDKIKSSTNADEKNRMFTLLFKNLEELCITIFEVGSRIQFEKSLYKAIESGEYLNADTISELFEKSRVDYFGDAIKFLPQQKYDWIWKPHYFRTTLRFYNYPYVFAELVVLALFNKYKKEGKSFNKKFKKFLGAGSSKSPYELINEMGMDPTTVEFWKTGFDEIRSLLEEIKQLKQ